MTPGRLEAPLRDRRPFVTRSPPIILLVSAAGDLARSSLALGTAGFELVLQQSYRAEFGIAASLSPPNNRAAARRQRDVWELALGCGASGPQLLPQVGVKLRCPAAAEYSARDTITDSPPAYVE